MTHFAGQCTDCANSHHVGFRDLLHQAQEFRHFFRRDTDGDNLVGDVDLAANPYEVGSSLCFREREFEPQNEPNENRDGNGFIALVLRAPAIAGSST